MLGFSRGWCVLRGRNVGLCVGNVGGMFVLCCVTELVMCGNKHIVYANFQCFFFAVVLQHTHTQVGLHNTYTYIDSRLHTRVL